MGDAPIRVLIVDDDVTAVRFLLRVLARFDVDVALTAGEALRSVDESHFDVIVCDLQIGRRAGARLCQEITRRRPRLAGRFLFLTDSMRSDIESDFLARKPHLVRPVDELELGALVVALSAGAPLEG